MAGRHKTPPRKRAFALIELPLVLFLIGLAGLIAGTTLVYVNGGPTLASGAAFGLMLPIALFCAAVLIGVRRER